MEKKTKKTISQQIESELLERLEALAESDNRSLNNTIETILKQFFKFRPHAKYIMDYSESWPYVFMKLRDNDLTS